MGLNDYAKAQTALAWVGSLTEFPQYAALGSGSGAYVSTQSGLIAQVGSRVIWSTRDISTTQQVAFQFDFSAITMSGLTLREFGVGTTLGTSGNLWERESLNDVSFDGTQELQLQITWEIF
jgi:hypothetical protein